MRTRGGSLAALGIILSIIFLGLRHPGWRHAVPTSSRATTLCERASRASNHQNRLLED